MMTLPLLVLRGGKVGGFTNKLDECWTLLTLHDDLKIPSLFYFSHKTLRLNISRPCWCCVEEKWVASPTSLMNVGRCSPFMMT
jgi:hypothetical protein